MGGGRVEGKGVCRGGQTPRVLTQATVGRGLKYVCVGVRAHMLAAEGQGGHKVAALQCWHVVYVCKSVFWKLITAPSLLLLLSVSPVSTYFMIANM